MSTSSVHATRPAPVASRTPTAAAPAAAASGPTDGSADLLRRTLPLMSRHAAGYAPDSYAVWYEYVRGGNAALRAEVDALVAACERLSHEVTFELHQKHLADTNEESVRKAGAGLLELMSTVRSSVEAASSDATEFDAQLAAFGEGINEASSAEAMRRHVDTMRGDVDRMNRSLSSLTSRLEASHQEVSRLQNELRRAREEAQLDPLSGIMNRRGFDSELHRLCRAATEPGGSLCLVMVDIDHFKKINDTYGHPFGDQVIRAVGQALSQLTQRKDVAARYGGEEFALLLPDTPLAGARDVADRIRAAIARGTIKRGNGDALGGVTISAGVAQFLRGEDPQSLVARADRALYASKQGGRNRVSVDG
ncbi:MAG: diguanylate cyclase [Burkholderiales bacterium]|jgi:diguanylate cyclase